MHLRARSNTNPQCPDRKRHTDEATDKVTRKSEGGNLRCFDRGHHHLYSPSSPSAMDGVKVTSSSGKLWRHHLQQSCYATKTCLRAKSLMWAVSTALDEASDADASSISAASISTLAYLHREHQIPSGHGACSNREYVMRGRQYVITTTFH